MKKLKITQDTAVLLFKNSNETGQQVLTDQFGPEMFIKKPITERIFEFEDVLADQNITQEAFNRMIEHDTEDEAAWKRCKLIALCLNEGPFNPTDYGYLPYFNKSGFGFSFSLTFYDHSSTCVGAPLFLKSRTLSDFAGKTFPHIYKPLFTFPNNDKI
jgi:hypothetical protein